MPQKSKSYEIGQNLETYCNKCKTEMHHVITKIKDDEISKVMCNGCKTTHKYYAETPETPKKRGPGRPRKTETDSTAAPKKRGRKKDWPSLVSKLDESEIVDYDFNEDFTETHAIRHKKFGVGVITKILADNKIEVVFEDEKKVLAQNYTEF
ncbi:MAG: hypothetical protein ACE5HS_03610 [bacterium]